MDKKLDTETQKDTPPEKEVEAIAKEKNTLGYYIPHRLWIVMIFFFGLIISMWDQLYLRFMATPELNTVIISTIFIVITLTITNIIKFQRSAGYINKLSEIEMSGENSQYHDFLETLKKRNYVFDCFTMRKILEKASGKPSFTPFMVTDKDSMLIKSKVGKRANVMRSNVAYLSGVLVMLGLIGTFWGMLDTLNAVGEAMAGLSGSVSGSGGLGSFIEGISKPLEGMGIAFSSSLFGLVGSLVGGLMNNFSSKGMDLFIEDFGFWLDSHIDKPENFLSAQKAVAARGFKKEQEAEEKTPSGFLAIRQTTEQLGELIAILKEQKGMAAMMPAGAGMGDMQHAVAASSDQGRMVETFQEYSSVQEQLLDKFIEHTSTQFYASNSFKQSLDVLNTTQSKSLQVLFDQKSSSDRLHREVKNLRNMVHAISKGEKVDMAAFDREYNEELSRSLDEKLAWMKAERQEDIEETPKRASGMQGE